MGPRPAQRCPAGAGHAESPETKRRFKNLLEVSGLWKKLDIRDAPVMRMWNVVHLSSKLLSPAAEAFRYFMLEQAEAHLLAHDAPLLGR